jgi:hypothetical protein
MNIIRNKIILFNIILIETDRYKDYHDYVINDIYSCFLILQIIHDACISLFQG